MSFVGQRYVDNVDKITLIQAHYRGHLLRKRRSRESSAATLIQRNFKGYVARVDYKRKLRANRTEKVLTIIFFLR